MSPELSPDLGSSNVPVHRFAPDLLTTRMFSLVRRCPADVPQCPPSRGGQRPETGLTGQCPRGQGHCGQCRERQWTTRGHWRERPEQAADIVAGHSDIPWGDSAHAESGCPHPRTWGVPQPIEPDAPGPQGGDIRSPDGWHGLMKPSRRKEPTMAVLLRIDFPCSGPFGDQMADTHADLAASISTEPGLLWKIWTENADDQTRQPAASTCSLTRPPRTPTPTCTPNGWGASGSPASAPSSSTSTRPSPQ